VDEWLAETLRRVNDSLPKRTETLDRLLGEEEPSVETVGGGRHFFDKEELKRLKASLPPEVAAGLRLPFVFTKKHELEESVYVVRGKGTEARAFAILMNLRELPRMGGEPYTYKPLVAEFLNRYPTLAAVGYI